MSSILNILTLLLVITTTLVGGFFLIKYILYQIRENMLLNQMKNFVFYEVKLPRSNEIEIQAAEQMFAGLLGIGAKLKGLKGFRTAPKFVSFELVAFKETIRFYVVCPKKLSSIVDRQINGTYPEAEINVVSEYNIFQEDYEVAFAGLKLNKEDRLPIRTYEELAVDSLATLTDTLSKIRFDEACTVQIVITPTNGDWRKNAKEFVNKQNESSSKEESEEKKDEKKKENRDTLEMIEQKAAKSGFHTDIRIVVVSTTKDEAEIHLNNILSSFDQYTKEGGNRIKKHSDKENKKIVSDFIHRIPRESMTLNIQELATIFHFPNQNVKAPFVQWLLSMKFPAPDYIISDFKENHVYLGQNRYRGKVKNIFLGPEDRVRHTYTIGQTGSGKSRFIAGMMMRDIKMGRGCGFIDPHGSDAEMILQQIPPERVEDVIIFDPADLQRPPGLNLLEFNSDAQRSLAVNEMLNVFDTLYDLKKTGGPIFEQYFRYGIMLLTSHPESGSTLLEVPKIFADDAYRKFKLDRCTDQEVVDFWVKQAEKAGGEASLKNVTPYIVSKLASFLTNAYVRPIISQQTSSINFKEIMDEGKILICKLSKGRIGEFNMSLLGMIIVSKILIGALEREDVSEDKRRPFYLYIDEFQNFLTNGIITILSEARKYQLSLNLAHQFLGQLTRDGGDNKVRDAIFGNVGNKFIGRVGPDDAEFLKRQFEGVVTENDLQQVENMTFYAKILVGGKPATPFTLKSYWGDSIYDMYSTPNPHLADIVRQISRIKYGKDRTLVENEIKLRGANIAKMEEPKPPAMGGFGDFKF